MESNSRYRAAALVHLDLLRREHARIDQLDKHYVSLASDYGLDESEIAIRLGIGVKRVRKILTGA